MGNFTELLYHNANFNLSGPEVEETVLATLINYPDNYYYYATHLSEKSFAVKANREVYKALAAVANESKIDVITVRERLLSNGMVQYYLQKASPFDILDFVTEICDRVHTDDNLAVHMKLLEDYTKRRELKNLSEAINQNLLDMKDPDEIVNHVSSQLINVQSISEKADFDINKSLSDLAAELDSKTPPGGIQSYITELDEFIYRFLYGDLIIIAGATSMGKTAFALELAVRNIIRGVPVAIFSLEMSAGSLLKRMIGSHAKIAANVIRRRQMQKYDWHNFHDAVKDFESKKVFIYDKMQQLHRIGNEIKKLRIRHNVRLFIIDYLQLVQIGYQGKNTNREQEIAIISRFFKLLAKETDSVIIPLSQISREHNKREGHRPRLSDLRESGAIEQDADMVIFPFRPKYYDVSKPIEGAEDVDIIIAKGRETGTGEVKIRYEAEFGKFYSKTEIYARKTEEWQAPQAFGSTSLDGSQQSGSPKPDDDLPF